MKKIIIILVLVAFQIAGSMAQTVNSPDNNLSLNFSVVNGIPFYSVAYKNKTVISDSKLGFETFQASLSSDFEITDFSTSAHDDIWHPVWGQYSSVRNNYNELSVSLRQKSSGYIVDVRFRVFNDGIGFRYEFPLQDNLNYLSFKDELTQFNMTANHNIFALPGDYDSNEFIYSSAPISNIARQMADDIKYKPYEAKAVGSVVIQTPALMKTSDNNYIVIHEAGLTDFSAMLLNVKESDYSFSAHLTPDKNGVKGYVQLPFNTPWRAVIISDDARNIAASQLIFNLNDSCAIKDVSWIKPQKFVGVWWEMFIGTGRTWAYSDYYKAKPGITDYNSLTPNGRHAANTDNVKKYIDFASRYGFDAVLVEGWNQGWEDWCAFNKSRQFLFTKPYPDFNVQEIHNYALSKGVKIIMHHETASNISDYALQLDSAFSFMVNNGYNSVKTGYVGPIIPRSEYHSSQAAVIHYVDVIKKAAAYHITVDSHEAVRPTGVCRTYPNWLSQESARGGEFESFGGNPCNHTTILPFTRLLGGPMDYTPGIFQTDLGYYHGTAANQKVHTTLVKQLALYVTMPSPMQMVADLPENYDRFPDAFKFIRDVPCDWDTSVFVEAEPGDFLTVARKDKHSDNWYIGAITDENQRIALVDLSFLPRGVFYSATIYEDADDASWDLNPQSYKIKTVKVSSKSVLKLRLARGGGAAVELIKQ